MISYILWRGLAPPDIKGRQPYIESATTLSDTSLIFQRKTM